MTGLEVLDVALENLHPDRYTKEVDYVHGIIRGILAGLWPMSYLSENIPSLERSGSDTAKQSED